MNFDANHFYPVTAEIFVAVMVLAIMLATAFARGIARGLAYALAQITLVVAALITLAALHGAPGGGANLFADEAGSFINMFVQDRLGGVLKFAVYCAMMVALLYGRDYLAARKLDRPEFFLLALLATLGMMVMITANHLLMLYIGLEMMSLALYALVAFDRDSTRSAEAGMKYFVLGAVASGLLLYGMSMIYGATGTLDLPAVSQAVASQTDKREVLLFGQGVYRR